MSQQTIRKRMHKNMKESQKERMLKFMEEHPRLKEGRCDHNFSTEDARRLWQKLSNILNSMEGPKKSWLYWRKSYADLRCWQRRTGKSILGKKKLIVIPNNDAETEDQVQVRRVSKKPHRSEGNSDEEKVVCHMIGETFIKKIPPVARSSTATPARTSSVTQSTSGSHSKLPPRSTKQLPSSAVKMEEQSESIAFVDDHVEHEYYKKNLELLERLSMAFETQAQSMQIQAEAFLELNETMRNIQQTLNQIANRMQ